MARIVTHAATHTELFIPGIVGDLGKVFPSQSKTLANLSMSVDSLGLTITFTAKGINVELLVPHANVKFMQLAPQDEPTRPSKSLKVAV